MVEFTNRNAHYAAHKLGSNCDELCEMMTSSCCTNRSRRLVARREQSNLAPFTPHAALARRGQLTTSQTRSGESNKMLLC